MVKKLKLKKSTRKGKKYMVVDENGRKIHFGATGYIDFTLGATKQQRLNYLKRHGKENWNNTESASHFARYLLWEKPTLAGAVKYANRLYGNKYKISM